MVLAAGESEVSSLHQTSSQLLAFFLTGNRQPFCMFCESDKSLVSEGGEKEEEEEECSVFKRLDHTGDMISERREVHT